MPGSGLRPCRATSCGALLLASASWVAASARVQAQSRELPLHLRLTLGAAGMVSSDQVAWLGFDSLSPVGDLQLGYGVLDWLDVRIGVAGGAFPNAKHAGGLLSPLLGAALGVPAASVRPWLQLDVGMGFTGTLLRPLLRAEVGVGLPVTGGLTLGPVFGYTRVFQTDGPRDSTDAGFLWAGLAIGFDPFEARRAIRPHAPVVLAPRVVTRESTTVRTEPQPAPASQPDPLMHLIEDALPARRHELLAPVLFATDSAQLEPEGIAMLHEVARELAARPELRSIEVQGYADSRGAAEHNLKLSEQRAAMVVEWLVSHGVARERLRLAAAGASGFVEAGHGAAEHAQNRRVVFRVIDSEAR